MPEIKVSVGGWRIRAAIRLMRLAAWLLRGATYRIGRGRRRRFFRQVHLKLEVE